VAPLESVYAVGWPGECCPGTWDRRQGKGREASLMGPWPGEGGGPGLRLFFFIRKDFTVGRLLPPPAGGPPPPSTPPLPLPTSPPRPPQRPLTSPDPSPPPPQTLAPRYCLPLVYHQPPVQHWGYAVGQRRLGGSHQAVEVKLQTRARKEEDQSYMHLMAAPCA